MPARPPDPQLYLQRQRDDGSCERGTWSRRNGYKRLKALPLPCPKIEAVSQGYGLILRWDGSSLTLEDGGRLSRLPQPPAGEIVALDFPVDGPEPLTVVRRSQDGGELLSLLRWVPKSETWKLLAEAQLTEGILGAAVDRLVKGRADPLVVHREQEAERMGFREGAPATLKATVTKQAGDLISIHLTGRGDFTAKGDAIAQGALDAVYGSRGEGSHRLVVWDPPYAHGPFCHGKPIRPTAGLGAFVTKQPGGHAELRPPVLVFSRGRIRAIPGVADREIRVSQFQDVIVVADGARDAGGLLQLFDATSLRLLFSMSDTRLAYWDFSAMDLH